MSNNLGIYNTLTTGQQSTINRTWNAEEHVTKATPTGKLTPQNPFGGDWSKDKDGKWVLTIHLKITVYTSWWGGPLHLQHDRPAGRYPDNMAE
jgi:hypothetical protein